MLILFLQVVALLNDQIDFFFDMTLLLLVPFRLSSLLVESLLEQFYFLGNLLFLAHHIFVFVLLRHVLFLCLFYLSFDLVSVLEVHVLDLALSVLDCIHHILSDCFLTKQILLRCNYPIEQHSLVHTQSCHCSVRIFLAILSMF